MRNLETIENDVFIAAMNRYFTAREMPDKLTLITPNLDPEGDIVGEIEFHRTETYAIQFEQYVNSFNKNEFIRLFIGEENFTEAPDYIKTQIFYAITNYEKMLQVLLQDLVGSRIGYLIEKENNQLYFCSIAETIQLNQDIRTIVKVTVSYQLPRLENLPDGEEVQDIVFPQIYQILVSKNQSEAISSGSQYFEVTDTISLTSEIRFLEV